MNTYFKRTLLVLSTLILGIFLVACHGDKENDTVLSDAVENLVESVILGENEALDKVTTNLVLPTDLGDVTIIWSTNNPATITAAGVVTRQANDTHVTLTAKLDYLDQTTRKNFSVKVLKLDEDPGNGDEDPGNGDEDPGNGDKEPAGKLFEFDFTNNDLGTSYSSNNGANKVIESILDNTNVNVIVTRTASNTNHATYKDPFLVFSGSTQAGTAPASIEFDLGKEVSSAQLDGVYWSSFDVEQVTKAELQAFRDGSWVTVGDIKNLLAGTLEYKTIKIEGINATKVKIVVEGTAPGGAGNNGARLLLDNVIFFGEGSVTPPIDEDPIEEPEKPVDSQTTTASYSGDTKNFSEDESANQAALINLDSTIFDVKAKKEPRYDNTIGLNKDGTIRLYSDRDSGDGNELIISIKEGLIITKIEIVFAEGNNSPTMGQLILDKEIENLTEISSTTLIRDNLNINSFALKNTQKSDTTSTQIWISSIVITYKTK